jgi:hypothetical protein
MSMIDSLRRQLWQRCRYLDCARSGLPIIEMKDVLLFPPDPALQPPVEEEKIENPKKGKRGAAGTTGNGGTTTKKTTAATSNTSGTVAAKKKRQKGETEESKP